MRVRKKINGLRQFGRSQDSLWVNVPDGVGQEIITRLMLWQGQWFLNLPDGTRYLTKILGRGTAATADPEIQARILGSTGVSEIASYSSSLDRNNRKLTVSATVNTLYGQVQISGYIPSLPQPGSGIGYFVVGESAIGGAPLG